MKRIFLSLLVAISVFVVGHRVVFAAPESTDPVRLERWPAGEARVYALEWSQTQTSALPTGGSVATGSLELGAEVAFSPVQLKDGDSSKDAVLVTFRSVPKFEADVMGQRLPSDELVGAEALVVLQSSGGVDHVRFGEADSALSRYLFQALIAELFPVLPQPTEATVAWTERLPAGDVETSATWVDDERRTLSRVRSSFKAFRLAAGTPAQVQIASVGTFRFAVEGPLEAVELNETVEAADADGRALLSLNHTLTLRLSDTAPSEASVVRVSDKPVVRTPGPLAQEIDVKRALLESRIGQLTFDELIRKLSTVDDPTSIPDRAQFVWQAAGLLELHPERAAALVPVFRSARTDQMRAQIVDLLVSAGHARAQDVLRDILSSEAATMDPQVYEQLYQRLGLVARPTADAVKFVLDGHASALANGDDVSRKVQAFTLGSMAQRIRSSDPALAEVAGDVLLDDVQRASDPREQALALRALGNAGDPRTVDAVRDLVRSGEPLIRASAAVALRRVESVEATSLLVDIIKHETGSKVQAAALDALRKRTLDETQLQVVRDLVVERQLATGAERELIALLQEASPGSPSVVQALQFLVTNPTVAPAYRSQARALLYRLTM